jgi:hypothetical protein
MSPIRKAGGRRSPSNNRENEWGSQKPGPLLTYANKRLRLSEGIGTPDGGQRFDDLPLLSDKGGDKSEDDSEGDIMEFRGKSAKSRTEKASESRNQRRTVEKDSNDERTLSKYLPIDISDVIGGPIEGPDDVFVPPEWLMEAIKNLYNTPTITRPTHQSDSKRTPIAWPSMRNCWNPTATIWMP